MRSNSLSIYKLAAFSLVALMWAQGAGCDRGAVQLDRSFDPSASTYELSTSTSAEGGSERVVVEVRPSAPWEINTEFPTSLELHSGLDISLTEDDAAAISAQGLRFEVPVGEVEDIVEGSLRFGVCIAQECRIETASLEWALSDSAE